MSILLAVPSSNPGGLDAPLAAHFGHCDQYTLVRVDKGAVTEVTVLPGLPHEHGGCTAPVAYLAEKGVTTLLAGGMGMRPLTGFQQAGIAVLHAVNMPSVGSAVEAFVRGTLQPFEMSASCQGGCHHD